MKKTKPTKSPALRIVISTWYDTVTPESAKNGDYASCGNDWSDEEYSVDELSDAVESFVKMVQDGCWDYLPSDFVSNVLYAADGQADYSTGGYDKDCLTIDVKGRKSKKKDALIAKLNDHIKAALRA